MAYSADSIDSLVRFGPGGAPADVGDEGHLQADDTFHDLFHHGGQPLQESGVLCANIGALYLKKLKKSLV